MVASMAQNSHFPTAVNGRLLERDWRQGGHNSQGMRTCLPACVRAHAFVSTRLAGEGVGQRKTCKRKIYFFKNLISGLPAKIIWVYICSFYRWRTPHNQQILTYLHLTDSSLLLKICSMFFMTEILLRWFMFMTSMKAGLIAQVRNNVQHAQN